MSARSALNFPGELLGVLEHLTTELLQYKSSPIPGWRLEQMQALCWDLGVLFASCPTAPGRAGRDAAEDWLVCFEAYARASEHARDVLEVVGWLWARGSTDHHAAATEEAGYALKDAGAALLRSTLALAQTAERVASETSDEAVRVRPDLAERLAALRATCARASLGLGADSGGRLNAATVQGDDDLLAALLRLDDMT